MSKRSSKKRSLPRRILRSILFFLLFLFISANLFILLSGRLYLYKGIANTYLIGKSGPGIFDKDVFASSTIQKAGQALPWKKGTPVSKLNVQDEAFMNSLKTSSFLVFRGDSLLVEKYWGEHDVNTVSNSFSAAKTFVALLVGIAIEEGKIQSLDEPVGHYLKAFSEGAKSKITIRHLLMMASGLDWEESGKNPLSENAESYYGTDLFGLVNRQKVIEEPGKRFNYQSGNSQLLGFIIEKATGMNLSKYAYQKIWAKIGTEHDAYWSLDQENGDEKAFCCLYGTSRDFGRLGKLILQQGKWGNEQVVPLWYMQELVKNPVMSTEEGIPNFRYGLHIWTYPRAVDPVYYCRGILGQYIISVPSQNLVIVRTGFLREKNIVIPEKYKNDQQYIRAHALQVGHPADLFKYIATAEKLVSTTK
jgi:CubicO group peptidase (beta-lactamase class C family)